MFEVPDLILVTLRPGTYDPLAKLITKAAVARALAHVESLVGPAALRACLVALRQTFAEAATGSVVGVALFGTLVAKGSGFGGGMKTSLVIATGLLIVLAANVMSSRRRGGPGAAHGERNPTTF